jgi:hypothetical protein
MEDPMCWEMDYHWLAEREAQEKQKQKQRAQEQRADLIDKLLSEANKQADQPEVAPAKETIPAK